MKNTVMLLLCLSGGMNLLAQDTIYFGNGHVVICKVLEISPQRVYYSVENVIHTDYLDSIGFIQYKGGKRDEFNTDLFYRYSNALKLRTDFKKNIFTLNHLAFFWENISCSYERLFCKGKASVKIPFSFKPGGPQHEYEYPGYVGEFGYALYEKNKIFLSGLEINYFGRGQGAHVFYAGISGTIGRYYYHDGRIDTDRAYSANGSVIYPLSENPASRLKGNQFKLTAHAGYNYNFKRLMVMGTKVGFGYLKEATKYDDYLHPTMRMELNIGVKF
jgi:hypothetical protein